MPPRTPSRALARPPGKVIDKTPLLTFREDARSLYLEPTTVGVHKARELLAEREHRRRGILDDEADMLEYAMGNGWDRVRPEDIGALTDATIISRDGFISNRGAWIAHPEAESPTVYAHMNYQVEDPIATWAEGKPVVYVKDVVAWTPKYREKARREHQKVD